MVRSLPASMGSEPITRTTVSLLTLSSDSVFCRRTTISGTDGRSTCPCDSSVASAFTKENTTVFGSARASTVDVTEVASTTLMSSAPAAAKRSPRGTRPARGCKRAASSFMRRAAGIPRNNISSGRGSGPSAASAPATASTSVEIGGALVLALAVLARGHRVDDVVRQLPVAQDGLRRAGRAIRPPGAGRCRRRPAPRGIARRASVDRACRRSAAGRRASAVSALIWVKRCATTWHMAATCADCCHRLAQRARALPCRPRRGAAATWRRRSPRCAPC